MNINIISSSSRIPYAKILASRCLGATLALSLLSAIPSAGQVVMTGPNGETIYWLSGNPGESGSLDNPAGNILMKSNDIIILDASKSTNPNFVPFTPWVAIDRNIQVAALISNGAASAYSGWSDGDPSVRYVLNPYTRLNDLIEKTPVLADLMPVFFTQSDPVYLTQPIKQSNVETPDWIKQDSKYGTSQAGYNVWPISIYSSDAFDPSIPLDVALAPRADMQNAAWTILTSAGATPSVRVQLMDYYGDYSPAGTGGATTPQGNYSLVTLEHVIFYGGRTAGSGGAIMFRRTENIQNSGLPNARSLINIKGDVAFVGNFAGQLGGAINAQESFTFDGNAYFVGNMVGAQYNTATGGIFLFDTAGGSSFHGSGGAMRVGSGNQTLTFNGDSIFIGNLAAGEGGAISLHNNATIRFTGKTVFMGNVSGLYPQKTLRRGGGNGGAIVMGDTSNKFYFDGPSYFIANQAGGLGGALATDHADASGANNFYIFTAPALFTDNVSGFRPEEQLITIGVEASKVGGVFTPPLNISGTILSVIGQEGVPTDVWQGLTTINVFSGTNALGQQDYGAKVRGGGAIGVVGPYVLFDKGAPVSFERNQTNGNGGALYFAKNNTNASIPSPAIKNMAASFFADTDFIANAADVNGGAIQAGLYGNVLADAFTWEFDSATVTPSAIYFGKAGAGTTLTMQGNISYSKDPVKAAHTNQEAVYEMPLFGGGAVFSIGGFYVESMYSFQSNQTKGHGGGLLIGASDTPDVVLSSMGKAYSLVLDPLDWRAAGSYSHAGDWALLRNNVAMQNGGAIASYDGAMLYIGSGAKFLDNYAGGDGGAIALGITSTSINNSVLKDGPTLDLRARTGDIIFSGNRAGVTIDASTVDFDQVLDPTRATTDGYMQAGPATGRPNDIYIGQGALLGLTGTVVATINMDAYEGMKISLDGGIEMDRGGSIPRPVAININTGTDITRSSIGDAATTTAILSSTLPTGLVVFDNASADVDAITTIGNGTLRIQGTSNTLHWGSSATAIGTKFDLQAPATLEANAIINAATIDIAAGATLRVLSSGVNPGTLTLNAGTNPVTYAGPVNLAGNGRINTGAAALTAASVSIGEIGHTAAQTLTLAQNATTLGALTLASSATLSVGLFTGVSDLLRAGSITLSATTNINLTSLAQGSFILATADTAINASTFVLDYKGTTLTTGGRLTANAAAAGNNITLDFTTSNLVLNWNTTSGTWNAANATWAGADTKYILGDAVTFDAAHSGTVSVGENVGVSGMSVAGNYTFAGDYGITTQASAWGGTANAAADGKLTLTSGLLTLANATGVGQRNEFTSGILINGGTLAAGTEAQLGAALSQIAFANTSNNGATLLAVGNMLLDGSKSLHSQQLTLAANNTATIATTAGATLAVINNTVSGNGGVFNVGANSTLNLSALGDIYFLNNHAAQGGALALADNATLNADIAAGKTVMFGLRGDRSLNTSANTTTADSIHGAATSIINKNGAGILSINSRSDTFAGAININAGALTLGEGTLLGSAASRVTVASTGILAGAGILGGSLTIDGGKLSIDAGGRLLASIPAATAAQVLTINGDFTLNDASLFYNFDSNLDMSSKYVSDLISVGGIVNMDGVTIFDFNDLKTGINTLIQSTSSSGYIAVNGNTDLISGGLFTTTGTDLSADMASVFAGGDFIVSKGGVVADEARYKANIEYAFARAEITTSYEDAETGATIEVTNTYFSKSSIIPLAEGVTLVSQINFYDTTKLILDSAVNNTRIYWTAATANPIWDTMAGNWHIPGIEDKTFATGDSIVFGAKDSSGLPYEGDNETNRTIQIDPDYNVRIADMTITGSDNWTFTGGHIIAIPGANNYKDENGADISTGQLVLDENFTGTATFLNNGLSFKGANKLVDGVLKPLMDIEIRNGTLVSTAGRLGDNAVGNNSLVILDQSSNDTFKGQITGTGNIIQTGTSQITLAETGFFGATNYYLMGGSLRADNIQSLFITGTLTVNPGAEIILNTGLQAGTLLNNGMIAKSPNNGDARKGPTSLNDSDHIRDPGMKDNSIFLFGDYHSDGGAILLFTFRDTARINSIVTLGNSSGTSHVIIRNLQSLDNLSDTNTVVSATAAIGTGTFFRPDGRPDSVNPVGAPKRDSLIFATMGAQRDLKLVMNDNDWRNSVIASATIGSIVPFAMVVTSTYEVVTTSTITTTITPTGTETVTDTGTYNNTSVSGTSSAHYFNLDGSKASLVASGTVLLGSGTVATSGSQVVGDTTTVIDIIVTTNTNVSTISSVAYGPSEIDYSEKRENYKLVQGRDGNWYIRNPGVAPGPDDLPTLAAAPVMAEMIAQAQTKALYQHINARHDKLEEGWTSWINYTRSEDRLRKQYYNDTTIRQNLFQLGVDYAFAAKDSEDYSLEPSISLGVAIANTSAEVNRDFVTEFPGLLVDGTVPYSSTARSRLSVETNTLSAYASARMGRFYLDMILEHSIRASYKTQLDNNIPFDMDGMAKGQRTALAAELGIIINPKGLGQLEIYTQGTQQWHHFDPISKIEEPASLTNPDGYNPIYDPNSPTGRRYSFTAPNTFRFEGGFRWGSHLALTDKWAFRPWASIAGGTISGNTYTITIDEHDVINDMNGSYFTLQGGAAFLLRRNWQFYLTYGFSGGQAANNHTFSTGLNHRW